MQNTKVLQKAPEILHRFYVKLQKPSGRLLIVKKHDSARVPMPIVLS